MSIDAITTAAAAAAPAETAKSRLPGSESLKTMTFVKDLGEGAFGKVALYKKGDTTSLAVKISFNTASGRKAAKRELAILEHLSTKPHPHIIGYHGTIENGETLTFALEFATNGDLLSTLERAPLNKPNRKRLTREVTTALQFIHKMGIMHRDIKPENILLDGHMRAKVTDFGFAVRVPIQPGTPRGLIPFPELAGTLCYMSPEMITTGSCTQADDYWALSVVICTMAFRTLIFEGADNTSTMKNIVGRSFNIQKLKTSEPLLAEVVEKLFVTREDRMAFAATILDHPYLI